MGVLLAALACSVFVFWLALRSQGADWYISETRADILYTGVWSFHQFPFFSFALNGGSYLLQDPEGPLLSPTGLLVLCFGPSVGLRLATGVWAGLGVLGFVQWLYGRVRWEAALLAGVAASTSLAVLWKVAVGNDMFLWALGLPGFLFALRRVIERRTLFAAVVFGLWIGVFLLGPTFFVGTYLFLPVVPLALLFEFAWARADRTVVAKTLPLLALSCALGFAIASPKLASWLALPMQRPTDDHGVLSLAHGLRGLWDYAITKSSFVKVTSFRDGEAITGSWDISERTMALSPIALLLALLGVVGGLWKGARRQLAFLALALVLLGLTLSCSWPVWHAIRRLTHDGIRVAPRFLAVSSFGACILVALGSDALLQRFARVGRWLTVVLAGAMLWYGVRWVRLASQHSGKSRNDAVRPEAIRPIEVMRSEAESSSKIRSFATLVPVHNTLRNILAGAAVVDAYRVVGNPAQPIDWWGAHPRPLSITAHATDRSRTTITHLSVQGRALSPGMKLQLRVVQPALGFELQTSPPGAPVKVEFVENFLEITNMNWRPLQSVTLTAKLPISSAWFVLAGCTLFGSLAFVVTDLVRRRRAARPAT